MVSLTLFAHLLRAAVLSTVALLFLTACGSAPVATPMPVTPTITLTPRPLPETRSAPTLPPTFTPTATFSPTPTASSTLTPTSTATLAVEDYCEELQLPALTLNGITIKEGTNIVLHIGGRHRNGVVNWYQKNLDTGEEIVQVLPSGQDYLMPYGSTLSAGRYEWRGSLTIAGYSDICVQTANFTVAGLLPTPEGSLLGDLLDVLIKHARRRIPTPTATVVITLVATPEVTPEP